VPDHVQLAVKNDNHVAQHVHGSGRLDIGQDLFDAGEDRHSPACNRPRLMVEAADRTLPPSLQLLIDASCVCLEQGHAYQIELPYDLLGCITVWRFDNAPELTAGLHTRQERNAGGSVPKDVAGQVMGYRAYGQWSTEQDRV
jgi:hypothetical protein